MQSIIRDVIEYFAKTKSFPGKVDGKAFLCQIHNEIKSSWKFERGRGGGGKGEQLEASYINFFWMVVGNYASNIQLIRSEWDVNVREGVKTKNLFFFEQRHVYDFLK